MRKMDNLSCDVLVIGAGPAGSIAAKHLAEKGLNVIVVEKKQEIGTPKRCAEGINANGLERVGLKPDKRWAVNEINGAVLYSPQGKKVEMILEDTKGYILERKIFEKYLATLAINSGAKYMVKTRAISAILEDDFVKGVEAEFMGERFFIEAKVTIAADGVESKIAKTAGISTLNRISDYHSCFQYEMSGLKLEREDLLYLFFGNEIAPRGYLWIFPKGNRTGNVGVGILALESRNGKRAKDYLDNFISEHPDIFEEASPIEINAGGVPVSSSVDTFVGNGFMIVGDAAQQVNPIHGGGISIAMNAAKLASEVAYKAIKIGDYSKEILFEYEKIWRETEGKKMKKLLKLRKFLENLEDEDFELLADILSGEDILKLTQSKYEFLLNLFLRKAPKLLPLAKKFLIS